MDEKKTSRSVAEEITRERKYWKRNNLWTLLIVAAILLYSLISGPGCSVSPGPSEINLVMHGGKTLSIPYESITAAELLERAEYGTMVEGREDRNGKSGLWEHPEWGSYTLCIDTSSSKAIRFEVGADIYLVSMGSDVETSQLYDMIAEGSPAF